MSHELIYTSVPRGLRPGASGFCTVAMTARMPDAMAERLELLSGYRPVFPLGDPQAGNNPVNWAHWRVTVGERPRSVLSRVAFAGPDYSQRSNKFAHHIVLEPNEQTPAGPAWVLRQPGVMEVQWPAEPEMLPAGRAIPAGDRPALPCKAWKRAIGDAGWAGVLADSFRANPARPAYLIFGPGAELLPLIEEALALLPESMRWQVTFSTYFTDLPIGATCAWRCLVAGSPQAIEVQRAGARALVIDLTAPPGPAPDGPLTDAARTGRVPDFDVQTQATATAAARMVATAANSASPSNDDLQSPLDRAIPRTRRRLPTAAGPTVETTAAEPQDASASTIASHSHEPRVIRDGVRGWVVAVSCVACVCAGMIVASIIAGSIYRGREKADHDNIARLEEELRKLRQDLAEKSSHDAAAGGDARTAPGDGMALREAKDAADRAQAAENERRKSEAALAAAQIRLAELQKQSGKSPDATSPLVKTAPIPDPPAVQPPASRPLPPVPDPVTLAALTPILLSPPPSGPKGIGQNQPAPWKDEDGTARIGKIDRLELLFPNGQTQYDLPASRTIAVEHDAGDALLRLTMAGVREPEGIARFHAENGKLSLTWKPNPGNALVTQVRTLLENSTILASSSAERWEKLFIFREVDNSAVSIPLDSPRGIAVPSNVASRLVLTVKDPHGTGWEATAVTGNKVTLNKKHGNEFLLPLDVTATAQPDKEGVARVQITCNWEAGKRKYVADHSAIRNEYGGAMSAFGQKPQETPSRAAIVADIAQCESDLKAENEKPEKDRNKPFIEGLKNRYKIYGKLLELESQADAFQKIGPLQGELHLPNGLVAARFTLELPQNSVWKPK
jgi:hypothetical protein